MDAGIELRVIDVDRIGGDIIVYFSDGKCAIYPTSLLWELLPRAREMTESDAEE
jgi:hypothetical protein